MTFQPPNHPLCQGYVPTPLSHYIFHIKYILFKTRLKVKPAILSFVLSFS